MKQGEEFIERDTKFQDLVIRFKQVKNLLQL